MKTLMKIAISIFLVAGILHICHAQGNNKNGTMENVKGETAENQTEQPFTIFGITLGEKINKKTIAGDFSCGLDCWDVGDYPYRFYAVILKKPFRYFKDVYFYATPKLSLVAGIYATCQGEDLFFETFSETKLECKRICNALEKKFNLKFNTIRETEKDCVYEAQTSSAIIQVSGDDKGLYLRIWLNEAFLNKIRQLDSIETKLDAL